MRQIIQRDKQHITSPYGFRKGFKLFHLGVDLRSWTDDFKEKLKCVLPEEAKFIRSTWEDKWGYSYIFKGLESGVTLKFIHIEERQFIVDMVYNEGFAVGHTAVTPYMESKKLGDHLHFETWRIKPFNPEEYMKDMKIDCE